MELSLNLAVTPDVVTLAVDISCPLQATDGPAALLPDVLPRPARLAARGGVRRRRPPLRGPLHRLHGRRQ